MSMTLQDALNNASSGSKLFDSLTPEQQQLAVNGLLKTASLTTTKTTECTGAV